MFIILKPFFCRTSGVQLFFLFLCLLSPSVFEHQFTTCSPSKHPPPPPPPSLTHTHRKKLMSLTCDNNRLWRSPAAPLQTHTQAAAVETQQNPDLCNNMQDQMWWQKSLSSTHTHKHTLTNTMH